MKKIFLSYAHKNRDWVERSLLPVLRAAAAPDVEGEEPKVEILIDVERFQFGEGVVGQMDAAQDEADLTMMVLTPDYVASEHCLHELRRAMAKPDHAKLPIKRIDCEIPEELKGDDPVLWCDLTDDGAEDLWEQLLGQLEIAGPGGLGIAASKWLKAARDVERILGRECLSVNLVSDLPGEKLTKFYEFGVAPSLEAKLPQVDLNDPTCHRLPGLYRQLLAATTNVDPGRLPRPSEVFGEQLKKLKAQRLLIRNFEKVKPRHAEYGDGLWESLRFATENRMVILMAESNTPASNLMPGHPVSEINFREVKLR
ncbi:MAG: toll/interleukin-1 receptor domain-containing protein [Verrucomicrobiota bacterium]